MAGKGDRYRPVDRKKWEKAWKRLEKANKGPKESQFAISGELGVASVNNPQ